MSFNIPLSHLMLNHHLQSNAIRLHFYFSSVVETVDCNRLCLVSPVVCDISMSEINTVIYDRLTSIFFTH